MKLDIGAKLSTQCRYEYASVIISECESWCGFRGVDYQLFPVVFPFSAVTFLADDRRTNGL